MLDRVIPRDRPYFEETDATGGFRYGSHVPRWAARLFGGVIHAAALDRLLRSLPRTSTPADFAQAALDGLGIAVECDPRELDRIPRRGRLIFIANHPFSALDGLLALALLGTRRSDIKVFANEDLCALPGLAPALLPFKVAGLTRIRRNGMAARSGLPHRCARAAPRKHRAQPQVGAADVAPVPEVRRARVVMRPRPRLRRCAQLPRRDRTAEHRAQDAAHSSLNRAAANTSVECRQRRARLAFPATGQLRKCGCNWTAAVVK